MHKLFKYTYFLCFILLLSTTIVSCHKENKLKIKTLVVKETAAKELLYYSGTVEPLSARVISSPVDGIIEKRFFKYGSEINKGQLLYSIKSIKQRSDLKAAFAAYLKAKQEAKSSKEKAKTSAELFQKGIVSKTEYKQDQNKYYVDNFAFIQTERKLQKILKRYGLKVSPAISLSEINSVIKTLNLTERPGEIKIYAPSAGIGLFQTKTTGQQSKKLNTGSQIKTGDILLYLGDKAGVSIKINVNEKDINHLFLEQKAIITSEVFPEINLHGYIKTMDLQASTKEGATSFSATIIVPSLPLQQRKTIHVGMNVKVAITIYHQPKILIPINAVFQQHDHSYIKILDQKTKKIETIPVTTGQTTVDSIVIISGLNPGDQVVLPD
jgi:multidrug efflux pump subunit AcrA (membrane-fusion protein)